MNDEKFLDLEGQTEEFGEELEVESELLSEDQLLKAVRDEIELAKDAVPIDTIAESLDYFDALLPAPEEDPDNEYNEFVSPEVRNAIESTLAEILPGFYGDMPVVFLPLGPGDERQAMEESHIVNHIIMTANKGYSVLNRAFKDALINRDALIKVWWDDRIQVSGKRVRNVPAEALAALQQELGEALVGAELNEDGTYTVDITIKKKCGKPVVEWVPCEDLLVNADHTDVSLDSARFVCHRKRVPKSDLIAFGAPKNKVDGLASGSVSYNEQILNRNGSASASVYSSDTGHESTELVVVAESYYLIDVDGDGIAERRRIITAGGQDGDDTFLMEEPWDDQPFAHGVPFYGAREWRGLSMTDRIKEIQNAKSDMMRQILDAGWRNLQQRIGVVERMVNVNDVSSSTKGGIIRMKDPAGLFPIPEVTLPHQTFALMESLDKSRRESGAGSIDSAPQAQEMGADSAHGIERIMSAVEESNAMVAKNLAETLVKEMYVKMHRMLKKYWPGVVNVPTGSSWLSQTPAEWADRYDASVAVGLSTGTRMRQAMNLQQVIAKQSEDFKSGLDGTLVALKQMYQARVDYSRLVGIRYPEKYWVDPESPEAKKAVQSKQEMAKKNKEDADKQLAAQSETLKDIERIKGASQQQIAAMKEQTEVYKADIDHLEKTIDQRLKLIELNAVHDKEKVPGDNAPAGAPAGAPVVPPSIPPMPPPLDLGPMMVPPVQGPMSMPLRPPQPGSDQMGPPPGMPIRRMP